jgi:hypothetical protein
LIEEVKGLLENSLSLPTWIDKAGDQAEKRGWEWSHKEKGYTHKNHPGHVIQMDWANVDHNVEGKRKHIVDYRDLEHHLDNFHKEGYKS